MTPWLPGSSLSSLIYPEHYFHLQPGEENHELASDYCLQNLYYHKFADVSPSAVTEFYEG